MLDRCAIVDSGLTGAALTSGSGSRTAATDSRIMGRRPTAPGRPAGIGRGAGMAPSVNLAITGGLAAWRPRPARPQASDPVRVNSAERPSNGVGKTCLPMASPFI